MSVAQTSEGRYYFESKVKEEVGGAYSTHEMRNNLVGKHEGKRSFGGAWE
jgi:hypothetical protein